MGISGGNIIKSGVLQAADIALSGTVTFAGVSKRKINCEVERIYFFLIAFHIILIFLYLKINERITDICVFYSLDRKMRKLHF